MLRALNKTALNPGRYDGRTGLALLILGWSCFLPVPAHYVIWDVQTDYRYISHKKVNYLLQTFQSHYRLPTNTE
jgi:hypothetical protein